MRIYWVSTPKMTQYRFGSSQNSMRQIKKKNIFYQRSRDGLYYAIGEVSMTETERHCEMSFFYYGGEYLKPKDTHILLSENEMQSVSYDYNPKSKSWTNEAIVIWKRQ